MTLDDINALDDDAFVAALAHVFEHSPWLPEAVLGQRPFSSVEHLYAALCAALAAAEPARQLALIRAHPQLAGKAAIAGELTESSAREQAGAGLDACSPQEYERLHALNDAYQGRFDFPFILAVRGHDRQSILAAMATRLECSVEEERAEALRQIERIAGFRLGDLLTDG